MLRRKIWERDVAGCRREGGACGSGMRGLGVAKVVSDDLWITWEREELTSVSGAEGKEGNTYTLTCNTVLP